MWTQMAQTLDNRSISYTGYTGRWWLHDGVGTFCPPHGGQRLVEHHVKASSNPALVGRTVMQQYEMSADGSRLTTTDVQIVFGKARVLEVSEWRRMVA